MMSVSTHGPCTPLLLQGKGHGLVTTTNLKAGELILTEPVLLKINTSLCGSLEEWARQVVDEVDKLNKEQLQEFIDLFDNTEFNKTPELIHLKTVRRLPERSLKMIRILRTNGISIGDTGEVTGIFVK